LTFQLCCNFLFFSGLEILEALFHVDFKFKGGFFLQQIKIGFMCQPLVA